MNDEPKRDDLFRHRATGKHYRVTGMATHSETGERMVIYRCVSMSVAWVRPLTMFMDGRFEIVHPVEGESIAATPSER